MNDCYIGEAKTVLDNAKLVDKSGEIDCPILMFVSDGKQVSANWIQYQKEFAESNNAKIIQLNCGHYVHYYESDCISEEIMRIINKNII